ncbi:MAG TPA: TetR/AcrR family transcriptional regulator [Spirochaetota bacterium]|nr:TetR/AcrR family transcriptional regulator [Spirochaetota bacterium]HPJ37723.1 TetR/AcrR family transcriptional regulator [Spirochaetota bacterium]
MALTSEEKILQAAIEEFAEFGLSGGRIDRIAERAEINKAMIYYHFKGKEALYVRILKDTTGAIYNYIVSNLPDDDDPLKQINGIASLFMDYLYSVDLNFVRIMLREIANGGKYMKDVIFPNVTLPIVSMFSDAVEKARKNNQIKDINPLYTFFQMFGSVVFFNALRIVLSGTDLHDELFRDDFTARYKENLFLILNEGIKK